MRLISNREEVLERLRQAGQSGTPVLSPNAETPDEMEGILLGAQRHATARGRSRVVVGVGFTATYPDHPQLGGLILGEQTGAAALARTAEIWLAWLGNYAGRPGLFDQVEVIPFLDHGWAPHAADLELVRERWFQAAMGIIMFDASALDWAENTRLTADFVREAGQRVVVEACPDKVYERAEAQLKHLDETDLLSKPGVVEQFVRATGADLVVPNLGTEHRTASTAPLEYRRDLARDIARRVGAIQALHGTSSLGGRLGTVGQDGICKINYYTGMARAATAALRREWELLAAGEDPPIAQACGSFIHRARRTSVAQSVFDLLQIVAGPAP